MSRTAAQSGSKQVSFHLLRRPAGKVLNVVAPLTAAGQAASDLLKQYSDLPPYIQHWAGMEELAQQLWPSPGNSLAELWRLLSPDVVVSVAGGAKLEKAIGRGGPYYRLNARLGELFAKMPRLDGQLGWSFGTGNGPGTAMSGPHFCLAQARALVEKCVSKCIGVPSALSDESPHPNADAEYSMRAQRDVILRELYLLLLGRHGLIVYPGFIGSDFERALGELMNYCMGRGTDIGQLPFPVILVDQKGRRHGRRSSTLPKLFGGSFYGPRKMFKQNAERFGLTKADAPSTLCHVYVDWPNAAEIIVEHISDFLVHHHGYKAPAPVTST